MEEKVPKQYLQSPVYKKKNTHLEVNKSNIETSNKTSVMGYKT
jgi:hypothetical protein